MDSGVRIDFCKGYSPATRCMCKPKQVSSVITLTARRGRQEAHSTG